MGLSHSDAPWNFNWYFFPSLDSLPVQNVFHTPMSRNFSKKSHSLVSLYLRVSEIWPREERQSQRQISQWIGLGNWRSLEWRKRDKRAGRSFLEWKISICRGKNFFFFFLFFVAFEWDPAVLDCISWKQALRLMTAHSYWGVLLGDIPFCFCFFLNCSFFWVCSIIIKALLCV